MSGVIMEDGRQFERCNRCGEFELLQNLVYEEPTETYECGRDLCQVCADELRRQDEEVITCSEEGCEGEPVCELIILPSRETRYYCQQHDPHNAIP